MRFDLIKCHGSSNDFPLIDARGSAVPDASWPAVARALADRAGPVGGDGLLLLKDGDGDHAFGFAMYNPDGSEAETCLNGLRCVARAGFERLGIARARVRLATSSADVERAEPIAPGVYTVREVAGPADLAIDRWPMTIGRAENVERAIDPLGPTPFTAVAMPNPHLVAFVDAVDEAELVRIGLLCEAAPTWLPRRANVSFAQQRGGDLFVRTHERGVGLTNACGSAMAASTYAAALTGRIGWGHEIAVLNRGGLVRASARADGMVTLSGNATVEWDGAVEIDRDGRVGAVEVLSERADEVAAWDAVRARVAEGSASPAT
jgi:diaminopimelate epimerase